MQPRNQLRLGGFATPTALVTYRRTIQWNGKGHLQIQVARGFFVTGIRHLADDTYDITCDYRLGYHLGLIVEPQPGTNEHARYLQWRNGGQSRTFYNPLRGVRERQIMVFPPSDDLFDYRGAPQPTIGGGGAVVRGHPFIVEARFTEKCVARSLAALGVPGHDQRVALNYIGAKLEQQRRRHGF